MTPTETNPAINEETSKETAVADRPRQDYEAAMNEVHSNLDVRRLMIVIVNVLLPAATMAAVTALAGHDLPPQLAWLPRHVLWLVGVRVR